VRLRLDIGGAVQGVGFRPFVYRLAHRFRLGGWVENTASGVRLEAEGDGPALTAFRHAVEHELPVNAAITAIVQEWIAPLGETTFVIRSSATEGAHLAQILPDLATCDDCLRELFDPADRRHRYPFINCTHCGPRYSIVEAVPYDRARTSMRHFPMCPACRREYDDPLDRRFHAEPNACPVCGPHIEVWNEAGDVLARADEALQHAADAVRQGRILAVKGVGGFHLLADARNDAAVRTLRARKARPDKPFAVMFSSFAGLADACAVNDEEKKLLLGSARPIVLVRRKADGVAPSVAPGNPWLGAFLPYAPLHHLLLQDLGFPVVATSGNLADEPICTEEQEALVRLGDIADLFLVHDRPIVRAIDDSVMRVVGGRPLMLRRARGFAPAPIAVKSVAPGVLALGGHMKTTVAITLEGSVLVSQHLGDLETAPARIAHEGAVADMKALRGMEPRLVARDLHPDYATSRMMPDAVGVQHHLAHVVSCMAEHGLDPPVLGVAWDGTGYGEDGTIWGGEFLTVTREGWRRVAHLRTFPLPGGERAAREPCRSALGLLYEAFGADALAQDDLPPLAEFSAHDRDVLRTQLEQGVNAPRTSSMGRLFDAVAALCGLRQRVSYEGQAAAEFEWAADGASQVEPYDFPIRDGDPLIVDWQPMLERLLHDRRAGASPAAISAAFHDGLAKAVAAVAQRIGEPRVVLSGGCFQNARLAEAVSAALAAAGFEPVFHGRVPPNDGGIALGQAVWAARQPF
jgi:hydrogenase maturation protein HypF